MFSINSERTCELLGRLYGEELWYGVKSRINTPPYYLGFGGPVKIRGKYGKIYNMPVYNLLAHRVDIVWKNGKRKVMRFRKEISEEAFEELFYNSLSGMRVVGVELSNDNRLWLDLSDYWIVILTNSEESWQFTCLEDKIYHVIATSSNFTVSEKQIEPLFPNDKIE